MAESSELDVVDAAGAVVPPTVPVPPVSLVKREGGRGPHQLRPMTAEQGVVHRADGSARFAAGETVRVGPVGCRRCCSAPCPSPWHRTLAPHESVECMQAWCVVCMAHPCRVLSVYLSLPVTFCPGCAGSGARASEGAHMCPPPPPTTTTPATHHACRDSFHTAHTR
jgi:hypothetical protein